MPRPPVVRPVVAPHEQAHVTSPSSVGEGLDARHRSHTDPAYTSPELCWRLRYPGRDPRSRRGVETGPAKIVPCSPTGWPRNSKDVTTPKLPPPPRSAQTGRARSRAGCDPSAVGQDDLGREQAVGGQAQQTVWYPCPAQVSPLTPVVLLMPEGTTRPCWTVTASTSCQVQPRRPAPWRRQGPRDLVQPAQVDHQRVVRHSVGRGRCVRRHDSQQQVVLSAGRRRSPVVGSAQTAIAAGCRSIMPL